MKYFIQQIFTSHWNKIYNDIKSYTLLYDLHIYRQHLHTYILRELLVEIQQLQPINTNICSQKFNINPYTEDKNNALHNKKAV